MPDDKSQNNVRGSSNLWFRFLAGKTIVWQLVSLVMLVGISSWLINRQNGITERRELCANDRIHAEMVALAIGQDISVTKSNETSNLLDRCALVNDLRGAAVIDDTGLVVAHTDISKTGIDTRLLSSPQGGQVGNIEMIDDILFPELEGRLFLRPLLGPEGRIGTVALLFPAYESAAFLPGSMVFLLPAGLLILAFIGFMNSTIKCAIRPTSEFLNQLSKYIGSGRSDLSTSNPAEFCAEIDNAIDRVSSISSAKESLIIENRVLSYDCRRRGILLDNIPEGIIMLDPGRNVLYANRAATEISGIVTSLTGGGALTSSTPEINELLDEAKQNGQAEFTRVIGDDERTFVLTSQPLISSNGNDPIGTLCHFRDFTAQISAGRAQGEFLSQISHELKSPLNTIITYVEALADDDLLTQDERRSYSNTLNAEAQRMARLIGNLLQISRIELGNLSGKFGFIKSGSMIAQITESMNSQAEGRNQTLTINAPDNLPAMWGDKDLLSVAISNLLSNALKYTPEGGKISVTAEETDKGLQIKVTDSGIGIREEDRELIFDRFYRTDRDEVQDISGTGLGLALVKEIVETHGGNITLESEVGHGSSFCLDLPVREVGAGLGEAA